MTNPLASFTQLKRNFLHHKLDDIIHLWARGSGQGTFFLSVSDGVPNFQCGLNLDFLDRDCGSAPDPPKQAVRQRGQKKQERNRIRAAKHQVAKAAAAAPAARQAPTFTGPGHVVGTALQPVLPLPLKKGDVFPPPTPVVSSPLLAASTMPSSPPASTRTTPVVSSTPSRTTPPATTPSHSIPTNSAVPPLKCRDEVLSDDSDDDELYNCGRCLLDVDSNSASYYCPLCVTVFHMQCITGHQCSYVS